MRYTIIAIIILMTSTVQPHEIQQYEGFPYVVHCPATDVLAETTTWLRTYDRAIAEFTSNRERNRICSFRTFNSTIETRQER